MYSTTIMKCDICNHKTLHREYWYEEGITVEDYGYCDKCGYGYSMAYSSYVYYFIDRKKEYKDFKNKYHEKNIKRHERIRRKYADKDVVNDIKKEMQKYRQLW